MDGNPEDIFLHNDEILDDNDPTSLNAPDILNPLKEELETEEDVRRKPRGVR